MKTLALALLFCSLACSATADDGSENQTYSAPAAETNALVQETACELGCVSWKAPYFDAVCGGARNLGQCISMDRMFGCVWTCQ